jgi:transcription elongation factor GreA
VRVWWTLTNATEEYEDALLASFAAAVPPAELAALPDRDVVLPWANLRRSTAERKATGLSGSLLVDPTAAQPAKPTFVVQVPDGDADGANGPPPEPRRRATVPRTPRATRTSRPVAAGGGGMPASVVPTTPPVLVAEALTADGAERLRAELEELTQVKRREVIARIRTAKEHGDLKENSDYHAAREEQSFLEGRVQAIEARLRSAVIVDAPVAGSRVGLGSVVTLDDDGEEVTYTIVGADESDPKRGRISSSSPVGRALVGHDAGDFVAVQTPAGERRYRILAIG